MIKVNEILVAEDDLIASQLLEMALEDLGLSVRTTTNGEEAWQAFELKPAPIIVSDWNMPELDGIELCRRIRNVKLPTYTYFILLTAKSGSENMELAMNAGVDDFLTKPLDRRELYSRLRVAQRIINYNEELDALKNVVPICSYCQKIRRDDDYWQKLEVFLEQNLNQDISHSICPDCYQSKVIPQFKELERKKRGFQA